MAVLTERQGLPTYRRFPPEEPFGDEYGDGGAAGLWSLDTTQG